MSSGTFKAFIIFIIADIGSSSELTSDAAKASGDDVLVEAVKASAISGSAGRDVVEVSHMNVRHNASALGCPLIYGSEVHCSAI
jgi:hypothetical protein